MSLINNPFWSSYYKDETSNWDWHIIIQDFYINISLSDVAKYPSILFEVAWYSHVKDIHPLNPSACDHMDE